MQLDHNFNKAANFIRSAAAQGAELAVLPEYHLTNWKPKDPDFIGLCDQWETYLQKYCDLARECRICIVPGTIVESHRENEKEEDKLLNVAYFIDHEGRIQGKYVKKNLWYVVRLPCRLIQPPRVRSCSKSLYYVHGSQWQASCTTHTVPSRAQTPWIHLNYG